MRYFGLAIDCAEAPPMVRFYEKLLGVKSGEVGPDWAQLWEVAVALAIVAGGTEAPWQPPDRHRERPLPCSTQAGHPPCWLLRGE